MIRISIPAKIILLCALPIAALAEKSDILQEVGAAERVEAADQLRTLTQELAAAACHLHEGVRADKSKVMLLDAMNGFDRRLIALRDGDPDHGIIGAEEQGAVLRDIANLHDQWMSVLNAANQLLEQPDDDLAMAVINDQVPGIFDLSNHLLSVVSSEYANPVELLASDELLLDIVGQQAMHAQRVAYEGCRVWSNTGDAFLVDDLHETVTHFETALYALHDGLPSVNVPPAPTEEIAAILEGVVEDWKDVRAITNALIGGETITPDQRGQLFDLMDAKMHAMTELTHLYATYSKRTLH